MVVNILVGSSFLFSLCVEQQECNDSCYNGDIRHVEYTCPKGADSEPDEIYDGSGVFGILYSNRIVQE